VVCAKDVVTISLQNRCAPLLARSSKWVLMTESVACSDFVLKADTDVLASEWARDIQVARHCP
jgi:hypothetical protein